MSENIKPRSPGLTLAGFQSLFPVVGAENKSSRQSRNLELLQKPLPATPAHLTFPSRPILTSRKTTNHDYDSKPNKSLNSTDVAILGLIRKTRSEPALRGVATGVREPSSSSSSSSIPSNLLRKDTVTSTRLRTPQKSMKKLLGKKRNVAAKVPSERELSFSDWLIEQILADLGAEEESSNGGASGNRREGCGVDEASLRLLSAQGRDKRVACHEDVLDPVEAEIDSEVIKVFFEEIQTLEKASEWSTLPEFDHDDLSASDHFAPTSLCCIDEEDEEPTPRINSISSFHQD